MRILMICLGYPPEVGGTEKAARTLARALAKRGHAVDVVTTVRRGKKAECDEALNVLAFPRPVRPPQGLRFVVGVVRATRRLNRPDIVHAHMASAPAMAALAVAIRARCPVVVKPSSPSGAHGGNLGNVKARRFGRVRVALLRRNVSAWIAASQAIEEELTRDWKVTPSRIARIPNPVDTSHYHPQAGEASGGQTRYLYVGRLDAVKGVDVLLEAWRRAGEPGRLTIVGDGPERKRLERGALESVRFVGEVTDPAPFYAEADVFVLPSLREGLSNAILEALVSGLPIIATEVGDNAAALGSSGRLVPAGDAMALAEALRAGPPKAPDVREAAQRFGADMVAQKHEELYLRLLR